MQIYSSSYSLRFLIHPSRTLAQRSCTKLPGHCTAVRLQCSVCLYYRPYHARIKVTCTGWAGLKAASGTQVRALQGTPAVQSSAHQCRAVHTSARYYAALHCTGASGQTLQQEEPGVHRLYILALLVCTLFIIFLGWKTRSGI